MPRACQDSQEPLDQLVSLVTLDLLGLQVLQASREHPDYLDQRDQVGFREVQEQRDKKVSVEMLASREHQVLLVLPDRRALREVPV